MRPAVDRRAAMCDPAAARPASPREATAQRAHSRHAMRRRETALYGLARLRPFVAAAYVAALVVASFLLKNPLQVALLLALVMATIAVTRRLKEARPYLLAALSVGLFIALLNPLFSSGGLTLLWQADLGPIHLRLSVESIIFGIGEGMRLATVILAFSLFSIAIDPDDQLALLSRLSFRSGLVVSLATRLFPVLSRDAARISDAQRSRGAELDRGRRRERAAARLPLFKALVTQSLERSLAVAASMEARGFGAGPRTRWSRSRSWRRSDRVFISSAFLTLAALVAGLIAGSFAYTYFPLLENPWSGLADPWWWVTFSLFLVPLALEATWQRSRASTM